MLNVTFTIPDKSMGQVLIKQLIEKSTYSFCPVSALFPEASDTAENPEGECPSVRPTEGKLGEKQSAYGSRFRAMGNKQQKNSVTKSVFAV